ncbi:unnamed protein product [Vicia faba]|uniref:SKP1-like protein n=1 Tax=Vicia faba TaxID=3906 RepID=A0AAV1AVB7_VICFA|nr:unnamed protein product [Vicia faba]
MSSSTKMITLKSHDSETFEVEEAVALESQTIKYMIEDGCAEDVIPLPNLTGSIFAKVEQATLFKLILAVNYLNIKSLLDLTCMEVAETMKGKTPEEIRTMFNIKNDFTPEEEAELRRENEWAFE